MASITINGISIDPLAQPEGFSNANLDAADASTSDYILIQTQQPLSKQQKAELASKKVEILEYVPDHTYLCHYKPTDLADIRALPFITWANTYMRAFKIAPALLQGGPAGGPPTNNLQQVMALPQPLMDRTVRHVDVVLQDNVNPDSVRDKLAAAAHIDPGDLQFGIHKARLNVQGRYLTDLAKIDEVRHVEEVIPMKLHNDIARGLLRVGIPLPNPGVALEGEGQVVAVADTGFDKGSTTDVHPAFVGRVQKLYALGRVNKTNDPDGHGTHVAGSVLGDGFSATMGGPIRGTAPKARLVLQSTIDAAGDLGGLPTDLHDLFRPPFVEQGANIHSNSWGSTLGDGRYDQNSKEVDDFVWRNRSVVICFAAGNEARDSHATGRVDPQSVTPPGTAKNCITVGASENNRPTINVRYGNIRPDRFPAEPLFSDRMADHPDGMAAFSSRGPTKDQRIKPDVVAPGTAILSARSRDVTTISDTFGTSTDPLYFFDAGTSMATPLVAGCAAVVREFLFKERMISNPSAALVKALLINGARGIVGQYVPTEVGLIPNSVEGFGRVNLAASIGPLAPQETILVKDEGAALDVDDEESISVTIGAAIRILKVTLVWTDPPGDGLQNDLDLIVRASSGEERHGNTPPGATTFDRNNNVEQILWPDVPPGNAQVVVRAHRITSFSQSYALVVRTA
jgi:serine protease AprX